MVTCPLESLSSNFDLNDGVVSDSGILFCTNDVDKLIANEVERIKVSKQQAGTISVCKTLFKKYDLAEGVVNQCSYRSHGEMW